MVGAKKSNLVYMVLIQSILFVIPAFISAILISLPLKAALYAVIFDEVSHYSFLPEGNALVASLIIGLAIPLLSAIVPIMKLLSINLNDSLNVYRNQIKT